MRRWHIEDWGFGNRANIWEVTPDTWRLVAEVDSRDAGIIVAAVNLYFDREKHIGDFLVLGGSDERSRGPVEHLTDDAKFVQVSPTRWGRVRRWFRGKSSRCWRLVRALLSGN